jgi:branched-chain amino acid transport system substrate-binding protein
MKIFQVTVISAAIALSAGAALADQGVSKDEIVLGSIQDLSGPIAGFGKQIRLGMMLRVDEANEQGGVNGRKIKLLVEDSAYDPRRAVLAAQKLVNQEKIFAMIGHLGTATNMAAMPVQFQKGVINWFPVTAARQMYEPFHKLKYSYAAPYYDQMLLGAPKLAKEKGAKKVCAMYQDDDFGLEVVKGAEDGLKAAGMSLAESTSYTSLRKCKNWPLKSATWWCSAPSSAKPSGPSPQPNDWASLPFSWAPARPTPI